MNEPMHDRLGDALRRLREDTSAQAATTALEGRLVEAFRAHHQTSARKTGRWNWISLAIAASLLLAVASRFWQPLRVQAPVVPMAASPQEAAPATPATIETVASQPRPKPSRKRRPRAVGSRLLLASSPHAPDAREFVSIPYAPPLTPYDEAQVVRVNMPGSSARRMGVPVMFDRVQADLVVGNDGLPRAIRLVSMSGNQY